MSPAGAGAGTKVGNKANPVSLEELDKELRCAYRNKWMLDVGRLERAEIKQTQSS